MKTSTTRRCSPTRSNWTTASTISPITAGLEHSLGRRLARRGGLVHHSDRGVQYARGDYIARLETADTQPSMSRAGCPYDNAMAESFMKPLNAGEVDARAYRDLDHAKAVIGEFIEQVYNRQRLHSALDYLSPTEFEANPNGLWTAIPQPTVPTTTVPI